MSLKLIQEYHHKVQDILQYGGSRNETAIRPAFQKLLEQYCADKKIELIQELEFRPAQGSPVRPDGTLKDALRQDWGYWESKDTFDSLDEEIRKKLAKGYPTSNILFEDSQTAVLIQNGQELQRATFSDHDALHHLLTTFVNYEPKEVRTFREAIERFKEDLPDLIVKLRELIEEQATKNAAFTRARGDFLELCRESINPHIVMADVREMIIQHILTEDIFITIFNESQFHRENNIARSLMEVIETFFTGTVRRGILGKIDPYIRIIKAAASGIADHHEKQRFLKVVYENFYRAYNPAAADRLGIIYTPNEIVRFMVESAEHLVHQNFGRLLGDKDVEILDPATGTGTFITEIIEHLPKNRLPFKYENEIHCNEVAILPYYIANLNIEYTYSQKTGRYAEFKNICFVDTLDNLGFSVGKKYTEAGSLDFGGFSPENLERIKRQNKKKISVIIGNPPYNANQLNENENNKNRPYPGVDDRIRKTYIAESTAQKTKLYDMYARFIRWASDRLDKNGVLAFITNRSLIDARTYDGFRKVVADEFSDIYIVDLGGDVRQNPKLSGPKHNVFAIQTGVAISFFVRNGKAKKHPCRIFYTRRPEMETAKEKLHFLATAEFGDLPFDHIQPDKQHNWINLSVNDWDGLLPVASKEVKFSKGKKDEKSIFKQFSNGVVTARDEWVYDFKDSHLGEKINFFYHLFESEKKRWKESDRQTPVNDFVDRTIKWTSELEAHLMKGSELKFDEKFFKSSLYRPFVKKRLYFDKIIVHRIYLQNEIFKIANDDDNMVICFSGLSSSKSFQCLASNCVPSFDVLEKTQCLPLYFYDREGVRRDNITDWALKQFQSHYNDKAITRLDIFHYVYAVLHDPAYREKYRLNLKREFPRIPFYEGFSKWAVWGERLMALHLGYEQAAPFPLKRIDKAPAPGKPPLAAKAILKADPTKGAIQLDSATTLKGVPPAAWAYRLGNRSAIEWVLEYHKERKPKDPTIRDQFNTYRFPDHKEKVIDLLRRVCTASVETVNVIGEMTSGT
ncbi:MAG: N-6 DNA methylase [Syntrophales bacterium]|jgi:predicted helicase|nr:N-6 DNA methylase [Syntrophales bacterium]MDD4339084.1 N-6 DNA methylase [Syntrophales bacterium]HOS77564.1 N-6 DNA methylase [Syntrophales bacterium]